MFLPLMRLWVYLQGPVGVQGPVGYPGQRGVKVGNAKCDHHWLSVAAHIKFKCLMLTYKVAVLHPPT